MIAKYNRRSLYWGAPGLFLQIAGPMMFMMWESEATGYVGTIAALTGFTMLMIGFGYYVKAKRTTSCLGIDGFTFLDWVLRTRSTTRSTSTIN